MIGAHNTLSYLSPTHSWMKIFNFISKCQKHNLDELIKLGVRCFDIRVWFDEFNGSVRFAHGVMDYGNDSNKLFNILDEISEKVNDPYVRIILEKKYNEHSKYLFKILCEKLPEQYPKITFYGGNYKTTWEQIHSFNNNLESQTDQYVGSMASDARWYEKFIPIFYAKRMNKKNLEKIDNTKINLFDFI
jgi:hypothetical protein